MSDFNNQHPITPPPELVKQWEGTAYNAAPIPYTHHIARCAARWGADQELEACISLMLEKGWINQAFANNLRAARRPKPPSLKEQALAALARLKSGALCADRITDENTIRHALEQLDD